MYARFLHILFAAVLLSGCAVEPDAARVINGLAAMAPNVSSIFAMETEMVVPTKFVCQRYFSQFTSDSKVTFQTVSSTSTTLTSIITYDLVFETSNTVPPVAGTALGITTDGGTGTSASGSSTATDTSSISADDRFYCRIQATFNYDPVTGKLSGNGAVSACDTITPCKFRNIFIECDRLAAAVAKYGC